jgi:regulator of protease activity HflC (stomatin/prohibitin superfamily)
VNPFTVFWRKRVSLRVRNFQSERIKVNDASGNPIETAAVVVWRVVDTADTVFDVENFEQFVTVKSETALRHLAKSTGTTTTGRTRSRCAVTPRRSATTSRPSSRRAGNDGIDAL